MWLFIRGQRITGPPTVYSARPTHSLDAIGEEVRFVSVNDDDVKEVSPVFSHHVSHSFVTAHRKDWSEHVVQPCAELGLVGGDLLQHLHEAKGTVSDEKEFFSMTNQSL